MDTQFLEIDSTGDLKKAAARVAAFLREGEVVALPTETVYGLAADATNALAVERVFEAKGRPATDPLIVHIGKGTSLDEVVKLDEEMRPHVEKLVAKLWPGPLTLIFDKQPCIVDGVSAGLQTVAVRMPEDRFFREVLKEFGGPIAAPSANRFGSISPTTAQAVMTELKGMIPLIVNGGACSYGLESTIGRLLPPEKQGGKPILEVLRPGPLTREDLRPFVKVKYTFKRVAKDEAAAAPGQLERHYAPATPLRVLDSAADWTPQEGKRVGLMVLSDESQWLERGELERVEVLSPGAKKLPEAMVRFYHCLRALDEAGLDEILVERLPDRGLGVTMNERLRRAEVRSRE